MNTLQIGDKKGKWEITNVVMIPNHTYRRPIEVIDTGIKGFHYMDDNEDQWFTTEDGEFIDLFYNEFKYID